MSKISADGKILVREARGDVALVDVATGARQALDGPPTTGRSSGDLSANGNVAIERGDDGSYAMWDLSSHTRRMLGPEATVGDSGPRPADALSADGTLLVQNDTAAVRVVDLASGATHDIARITDAIFAVAISSDDRSVAAGGRAGSAIVWDRETREQRGVVAVGGWVWDLAFSPDGAKLAVAATDGILRILELSTGHIQELRGHVGTVAGASFSLDGQRVLSAGSDGTVRLWDLSSGRGLIVRREPTGLYGVGHSADGTLMDLLSPGKVRIWDAHVLPPLEADPTRIKPWLEQITSSVVDERGHLRTP
jgi:WD40 repeat protein